MIFGQIIKTHTFIQMKDNKIQKEAFPWNLLKILSYSRTISQFLNINDWSFFTFQPEQQIAHPATPRRGWPQVECSLTFYPSSPFHLPPPPRHTHTHSALSTLTSPLYHSKPTWPGWRHMQVLWAQCSCLWQWFLSPLAIILQSKCLSLLSWEFFDSLLPCWRIGMVFVLALLRTSSLSQRHGHPVITHPPPVREVTASAASTSVGSSPHH